MDNNEENSDLVVNNSVIGFKVENDDPEKTLYEAKKSGELEQGVVSDKGKLILAPNAVENLKYIIGDILSGNTDALNNPLFKSLEISKIKKAIEWLSKTNKLPDNLKASLLTEGWRMSFKYKPPTIKDYLTPYFIGEQATTLHWWIRNTLENYFDPLSPYRSLILSSCVGAGKDQPLDSKVYINNSEYKLMGDIELHDKVLSSDGTQTEVIAITDWEEDDVYELEMDNGKTMRCGPHHIHHVSYRKDENNKPVWEDVETIFILKHPEYDFEFMGVSLV